MFPQDAARHLSESRGRVKQPLGVRSVDVNKQDEANPKSAMRRVARSHTTARALENDYIEFDDACCR